MTEPLGPDESWENVLASEMRSVRETVERAVTSLQNGFLRERRFRRIATAVIGVLIVLLGLVGFKALDTANDSRSYADHIDRQRCLDTRRSRVALYRGIDATLEGIAGGRNVDADTAAILRRGAVALRRELPLPHCERP